jgi:hypothetical protein
MIRRFEVKPIPPLVPEPLLAEPRPTAIEVDQVTQEATPLYGERRGTPRGSLAVLLDVTALNHELDLNPVPAPQELGLPR